MADDCILQVFNLNYVVQYCASWENVLSDIMQYCACWEKDFVNKINNVIWCNNQIREPRVNYLELRVKAIIRDRLEWLIWFHELNCIFLYFIVFSVDLRWKILRYIFPLFIIIVKIWIEFIFTLLICFCITEIQDRLRICIQKYRIE